MYVVFPLAPDRIGSIRCLNRRCDGSFSCRLREIKLLLSRSYGVVLHSAIIAGQ